MPKCKTCGSELTKIIEANMQMKSVYRCNDCDENVELPNAEEYN